MDLMSLGMVNKAASPKSSKISRKQQSRADVLSFFYVISGQSVGMALMKTC